MLLSFTGFAALAAAQNPWVQRQRSKQVQQTRPKEVPQVGLKDFDALVAKVNVCKEKHAEAEAHLHEMEEELHHCHDKHEDNAAAFDSHRAEMEKELQHCHDKHEETHKTFDALNAEMGKELHNCHNEHEAFHKEFSKASEALKDEVDHCHNNLQESQIEMKHCNEEMHTWQEEATHCHAELDTCHEEAHQAMVEIEESAEAAVTEMKQMFDEEIAVLQADNDHMHEENAHLKEELASWMKMYEEMMSADHEAADESGLGDDELDQGYAWSYAYSYDAWQEYNDAWERWESGTDSDQGMADYGGSDRGDMPDYS